MSPGHSSRRWVLRRGAGSTAFRLFCFPYAGGNAAAYLPWQALLGSDIEVCAIQLPGRGSRYGEPLLQDVDSASRAITEAIGPLLDRPFAFFGHSLGALLAFEAAHQLRDLGMRMPSHLVASGALGPHVRDPKVDIHLLDDADLTTELQRYGGTPQQILESAAVLSLVLPIVRADFSMATEYEPPRRPPLELPITVFAGRDDEVDDTAHYEAWFRESSMHSDLHWFDGDHFFINTATEQVLGRLKSVLASGPR